MLSGVDRFPFGRFCGVTELDHRIDRFGIGRQAFGVGPAADDRLRRTLQAQGIERLDQPTFGATSTSEVEVGTTVDQHQHRNVRETVGRLIETQRHRHRHTTHRTDLEVEDREIRDALLDLISNDTAFAADGERVTRRAERIGDLVDDPIGIGGKQDMHADTLPARTEQLRADPVESDQIVHVLVEKGQQCDRSIASEIEQWSE